MILWELERVESLTRKHVPATPPCKGLSTRHVAIRVEIRARTQFFDLIFEGNFGGLLVLKMGHAAYRRKAPDVYFPKKISLHGSNFGGKSYGSRKSGRLSCFSHAFPAKIPVNRGMLPANREFHVVAGVVIFPTHPGLLVNLQRVGKTLRAKAAVREKNVQNLWLFFPRFLSVFARIFDLAPDVGFRRTWYLRKACAAYFCKVPDSRESELGLVRYGPANRGHRSVFGLV